MRRRLRFSDFKASGLFRNRPSLKKAIDDDGFPPGELTGKNSRTWDEQLVDRWIARRPTAPKAVPPLNPGKRRGRPRKNAAASAETNTTAS